MKEFYTYEQQIEKLKRDGLTIEDEQFVIKELQLEGYYNIINGYAMIFKNGEKFIKGTNFENINHLYDFDKILRSIVYKYTSSAECHFKAILAHEFSRIHGVDEKIYLNKDSFSPNKSRKSSIETLITICEETIKDAIDKSSTKYREYIHHNLTKHQHVPLWVLIRAITFGTTSIFYENLKDDEKDIIAEKYSLTGKQLSNILEVVVSFRNIVAHGERTFCARLPKKRLSTELSITNKLCIEKNDKGDNKFGRNDFFALLICCKYLLQPVEFAGFMTELTAALDTLEQQQKRFIFVKIKTLMGLKSDNWKKLVKLKI